MSLEIVPELYPTAEELQDPIEYLSKPHVVRLGLRYGLLKLCPPVEFEYESNIDKTKVNFTPRLQNLSELQLLNRARWFFIKQLYNFNDNLSITNKINKDKPYTVVRCNSSNRSTHIKLYLYDFFIILLKFYNNNNNNNNYLKTDEQNFKTKDKFKTFHNFTNLTLPGLNQLENDDKLWISISQHFKLDNDISLSIFNKYLKDYYQFLYHFNELHNLPAIELSDLNNDPVSLLDQNIYDYQLEDDLIDLPPPNDTNCNICHMKYESLPLHECKTCNNWFHDDCFKLKYLYYSKIGEIISNHCHECVIGNGIYGFTMDNELFTISEFAKLYKIQNINDLGSMEDEFWDKVNNCMSNDIVKYGADLPYPNIGNHSQHPMNLLNLPNNKRSLLRLCKSDTLKDEDEISGMTLPWLYVGSKYSTFCWHMEDQYTLSANYQHEGAPKIWYSIPPQSCYDFGKSLYDLTPDLFIKDQNLVHQLTCLISPYDSHLKHLKIFKAIQHPGEFIITFPQCYHSGFNTGYNFNEAVNFTTDFWIDFGTRAITDYKFTRKICVFDIYVLLESILKEYLNSTNNNKVANLSLYRDAFNVLLNHVNTEMKRLAKLSEIGVEMFHKSNFNLSSGLADNEIICSKCHTTCTFASCNFKKHRDLKEIVVLCLEHGLQQMNRNIDSNRLTVNLTQDMDNVLELLRQCGMKLDQ